MARFKRKQIEKEDKLTERLSIRISEKDREAITQVSAGFGMTISEYLRDFSVRITQQIYERKNDNNG